MKLISLPDYSELPGIEHNWLVKDLIPARGIVMLNGEAKVGKSTLALQLAMCIAQGNLFLDKPVEKSQVLYLQFDTSDSDWSFMLNTMKKGGVSLPYKVFMLDPASKTYDFDILNPASVINLELLINECDPGLVVIDVLSKIHHVPEDKEYGMKLVSEVIEKLSLDRAIMVLAHLPKNYYKENTPSPIGSARGSNYIDGRASMGMLLQKTTDKGNAILHIQPRIILDYKIRLTRNKVTSLWEG